MFLDKNVGDLSAYFKTKFKQFYYWNKVELETFTR